MSRVLALAPDLFFASKIQATLEAAGHSVQVVSDPRQVADDAGRADLVVADLDAPGLDPAVVVSAAPGKPSLGFYSHVDVETRKAAEAAGFDLVVPRSRMAREMAALVEKLANG